MEKSVPIPDSQHSGDDPFSFSLVHIQSNLIKTNFNGPTKLLVVLIIRSAFYQDIVIHVQYYSKPNRAWKTSLCLSRNLSSVSVLNEVLLNICGLFSAEVALPACACSSCVLHVLFVSVVQFTVGHTRGSSTGGSRITRNAYSQSFYTAMMKECFSLWGELELESGREIYMYVCVGIEIGSKSLMYLGSSESNARFVHD